MDGDGKLDPVQRPFTLSAPPFRPGLVPQGAQTTARSFTRPSTFQLQNTSTSLATNYRVNFINEFPALFPPTSLRNPYSVVPPNPFPLPLPPPLIPTTPPPDQPTPTRSCCPWMLVCQGYNLPLDLIPPEFDGRVNTVSCNNRAGLQNE